MFLRTVFFISMLLISSPSVTLFATHATAPEQKICFACYSLFDLTGLTAYQLLPASRTGECTLCPGLTAREVVVAVAVPPEGCPYCNDQRPDLKRHKHRHTTKYIPSLHYLCLLCSAPETAFKASGFELMREHLQYGHGITTATYDPIIMINAPTGLDIVIEHLPDGADFFYSCSICGLLYPIPYDPARSHPELAERHRAFIKEHEASHK